MSGTTGIPTDGMRWQRKNAILGSFLRLTTVVAFIFPHGCGPIVFAPGDLGVSPGGQEDIADARSIIANGGIPDPDIITVEGFLSEHSIPIEKPASAGRIFARASTAWNKDFDAFTPLVTVQIGFGTTVNRETFERLPLNLTVVIDRSGSMGRVLDERSGTTKLDAVKIAVDRLLAQLTADDRISVVSFNEEPQTRLQAALGTDIAAVKTALDEIDPFGGTDLADGLRRGMEVTARNSAAGRSDRVFVFTDAQLRSRNELRVREFLDVMADYARDGIGTSVFGVGSEFGFEIAYDIGQIRGGNSFYLSDYDRIVTVFDDEFDFLVTPVAYDVRLSVTVPFEFDVVDVHGIDAVPPFTHDLTLTIPTLFMSDRQGGGAVFVRSRAGASVDFAEGGSAAQISLSYSDPDGTPRTQSALSPSLPAGLDPDAAENYFEDDATRRGVLLLNTVLVLKSVCEDAYLGQIYWDPTFYDGWQLARTRLIEFLPVFDALAEGLEDRPSPNSRALSEERALLVQLLENLGG